MELLWVQIETTCFTFLDDQKSTALRSQKSGRLLLKVIRWYIIAKKLPVYVEDKFLSSSARIV